jgi:hypothetical protein
MDTLKQTTIRALARDWLKKQEEFIQTVPADLQADLRLQLGCSDQADSLSEQIISNTGKDIHLMVNQLFSDYSDVEYMEKHVDVYEPQLRPHIAKRLGVPQSFTSATISYKDSTLSLIQVVTVANLAGFREDLLNAGLPQDELDDALDASEKVADKDEEIEYYSITYTVPLLLIVGTRLTKNCESL